ncbi:prepilin peptidase [Candidatus Kaiserbacteria bacterium]|nr:prepilin peptidase [Candidatus Kaiserbacteria bacterium]
MTTIVFGLFGLIVGSFLNVVVLRHGVRSTLGRSGCMSCGTQLRWYDMIPVVSWLALGGRCRVCRARVSFQYPLVEAATAVGFGFIGASSLPMFSQIIGGIILALLICIAAYDMLHTIIPDEWAYAFAGLALLFQFLVPHIGSFSTWMVLAGPLTALPLFALWFFSHGRWMGLGDAKLALGIGWLLGPAEGLFAVFGAFIVGGVVSAPLLVVSSEWWRRIVQKFTPTQTSRNLVWGFTMKSEIPFGPFLILSCIILWFSSINGIDPLQALGLLPS